MTANPNALTDTRNADNYPIFIGGVSMQHRVRTFTKLTYREAFNRPGGWILELPEQDDELGQAIPSAGGALRALYVMDTIKGDLDFVGPVYPGEDGYPYSATIATTRSRRNEFKGTDFIGMLQWRLVPDNYINVGGTEIGGFVEDLIELHLGATADVDRRLLPNENGHGDTPLIDIITGPIIHISARLATVYAVVYNAMEQWGRDTGQLVWLYVNPTYDGPGQQFGNWQYGVKDFSAADSVATFTLHNGRLAETRADKVTSNPSYIRAVGAISTTGGWRDIRSGEHVGGIYDPSQFARIEAAYDMGTDADDDDLDGAIRVYSSNSGVAYSMTPSSNTPVLNVGDKVRVLVGGDFVEAAVTEKVTTIENGVVNRTYQFGGTGLGSSLFEEQVPLPVWNT